MDEYLAAVMVFGEESGGAEGCSVAGGREREGGLRGHPTHFSTPAH